MLCSAVMWCVLGAALLCCAVFCSDVSERSDSSPKDRQLIIPTICKELLRGDSNSNSNSASPVNYPHSSSGVLTFLPSGNKALVLVLLSVHLPLPGDSDLMFHFVSSP